MCVEGLIDQRVDMSDDTVSWKLFRLGTVSGLSHGVGREGGDEVLDQGSLSLIDCFELSLFFSKRAGSWVIMSLSLLRCIIVILFKDVMFLDGSS